MTSRRAANLAIVAVLVVVGLGNLRRDATGRALHAVGLQQAWDVYAPEPVHFDVDLSATLTFPGGARSTWRPPRTAAWAALRSHRWLMIAHRLATDPYAGRWEGLLRWIASTARDDAGNAPSRLVLHRRWSELPPPGVDPRARRWYEADLFVLDLP